MIDIIANTSTVFDSIHYKKGDEIPDFFSIEPTQNIGGVREYQGLSVDANKLPTVAKYPQYENNLRTGSTCFMVDTAELYIYQSGNDTWYKI